MFPQNMAKISIFHNSGCFEITNSGSVVLELKIWVNQNKYLLNTYLDTYLLDMYLLERFADAITASSDMLIP